MITYTVKPGDCMLTIAARHGFGQWEPIYQHGANAELRSKRPDPFVLHPGDVVHIPDRVEPKVAAATDKTHVFARKILRRTLRIQLLNERQEKLASMPFSADDGIRIYAGHTDDAGILKLDLPVEAKTLKVFVLGWAREYQLGALNPVREETADDGVSGAQARLLRLGFHPGPIDGRLGPRTRAALVAFQRSKGLALSGKLDDETRAALHTDATI